MADKYVNKSGDDPIGFEVPYQQNSMLITHVLKRKDLNDTELEIYALRAAEKLLKQVQNENDDTVNLSKTIKDLQKDADKRQRKLDKPGNGNDKNDNKGRKV